MRGVRLDACRAVPTCHRAYEIARRSVLPAPAAGLHAARHRAGPLALRWPFCACRRCWRCCARMSCNCCFCCARNCWRSSRLRPFWRSSCRCLACSWRNCRRSWASSQPLIRALLRLIQLLLSRLPSFTSAECVARAAARVAARAPGVAAHFVRRALAAAASGTVAQLSGKAAKCGRLTAVVTQIAAMRSGAAPWSEMGCCVVTPCAVPTCVAPTCVARIRGARTYAAPTRVAQMAPPEAQKRLACRGCFVPPQRSAPRIIR